MPTELSPNSRLGKKVHPGERAFVGSPLTAGSQKGSTTPEAELASGRLLYNWNRYYDPKVGRYITADGISVGEHVQAMMTRLRRASLTGKQLNDANDPIIRGGNIFGVDSLTQPLSAEMNPFAYVDNNPLRWTDPTGQGKYIGFPMCIYHSVKVGNAIKECQNQCGSPEDLERTIRFIDVYSPSGSLDEAMRNCVCKKLGPGECTDWLKSCGTGGTFNAGPRPGK